MNYDDSFLRRQYLINLFPIMFSILGGTVNALIDSVFISLVLGKDGLSAVTLSMPVYLVLCSLGALIASGGSLLSAREAGKENIGSAVGYYHSSLTLTFICGVLFSAFAFFCRPLSDLLAQGSLLNEYIYQYIFVSLLGSLPFMMLYSPVFYLQLAGKRKEITMMTFIMVSLDAILDAVLLFIYPMGITGAAIASVASTLIACIYGFACLNRKGSDYRFSPKKIGVKGTRSIIRFGSPTALGNFYDAVRLLIINALILKIAGVSGAAVWAILNTLSELSLIIVSGIPQAAAPMTGVYYAAHENTGIRVLFKIEMVVAFVMSMIFGVSLLVLHGPLEILFNSPEDLTLPLLALSLSVLANVISTIWSVYFNTAGRIGLSNFITVMRRLVFPIAVLFIYGIRRELYLWNFLPISAVLSIILTWMIVVVISARSKKSKVPLSGMLLLDDHLERENKVLDYSVAADIESVCDASERIKEFCQANNMDKKNIYRMGLAIEELLTVMIQKSNSNLKTIDMRSFALEETTGVRIRCAGERYNPFEQVDEDEDFYMGISMLEKTATYVHHSYTLGMNTIIILL